MTASPTVSVVIPCRNEQNAIESCLRSMLAQDPPAGGFEIIVADGMSDDGTRAILERMAREDGRVRVVDNPERVTPCGMNAGIAAASGRYIAIAGAHCRYASDYLRQSVRVLEETGADNAGGPVICQSKSLLQKAIAAAHHSPFSVGGARWHRTDYDGPADTVFGGLYRREVFDRIGMFDTALVRNQDDEFNLRLIRGGGKIWQSPLIKSWYYPRNSLRALFHQYFQFGYWKVRVIQKHRIPASIRHVVPAAFALAGILLPLLALIWPLAGLAWLGLVTIYFVCSALASLSVARHEGWALLPLMPPVFACYHFGYALGFLDGIVDFVIVRRGPKKFSQKITRTA